MDKRQILFEDASMCGVSALCSLRCDSCIVRFRCYTQNDNGVLVITKEYSDIIRGNNGNRKARGNFIKIQDHQT